MTLLELQEILGERIRIAGDTSLTPEQRKQENDIFFRHNNWWRSESQVKDTAIDWCKLYYLLKETLEG